MTNIKLLLGNCLETMKTLPDNSVDSIVSDPPYGLSFMSKAWDYSVPSTEIWEECLRVLKPGGHLLAFGGTRTYHRLVVNIEDAGFEIRDQIMWIYGSGFPKSMDISKAIDKEAGATREVLGVAGKSGSIRNAMAGDFAGGEYMETAPATEDAKRWSGYGTALKPANEPICLARKPLSEKTVAKNVLKHGVGGLNVDASRIGYGDAGPDRPFDQVVTTDAAHWGNSNAESLQKYKTGGRFPANILFDEAAALVLDEQSGVAKPKEARTGKRGGVNPAFMSKERGDNDHQESEGFWPADPGGGASRFFATFKQDKQCNANTVKLNLSQQRELDYFVAKLAAISERQDTDLSNTLKVFTLEMRHVLKNACATSITPILNTVQRFSQELWHTSMLSNSPVSSAEALMLTDTMRTIQGLLMSSSFAEAATSNTTLSETAPGELDLASKFIYVAKASKKDRGEGNTHPTVKPIKLMEYLIRLVTPEGGIVLDPFMGSGTTGVAAKALGFGFIGCELDESYMAIAKKRIEA